jgi:hypothetical protein
MALITDLSDVFSIVHLAGYTGQFSGTQNTLDMSAAVGTVSFTSLGKANTTSNLTTKFNTYYKMQGFNPVTQIYENWHSMGTPLMTPPSGNALENVSIVFTWMDR